MGRSIDKLLGFDYKIGDVVEVVDEDGKWYQAKIIALNLESETTPYTLHCQALPGQGYMLFQFSVPEGDYRKCLSPLKVKIKLYKIKIDLYWRNKLIKLHEQSYRKYHNLSLVNDLLKKLRTVPYNFSASDLKILNCAILFNNAVYDTSRSDNKEMCVKLLYKFNSKRNFLSKNQLTKVEEMIMATKNHLNHPKGDFLTDLFLDLDLSVLASNKSKFKDYNNSIREEYLWMSDDAFLPKRTSLLSKYKNTSKIFRTDWGSKFETRAKNNLKSIK